MMNRIVAIILALFCLLNVNAQLSPYASFESKDGENVTIRSWGEALKGKEAQIEAVKNAFRALLYEGIPGLNNAAPMMTNIDNSFDYRFFDNQYKRYLVSDPEKLFEEKVMGQKRAMMLVSIDTEGLKKAIRSAGASLSPYWQDGADSASKRHQAPMPVIRPSIVVIPYMKDSKADFSLMAEYMADQPVVRSAINAVVSKFGANGYVTKDLVVLLQNSETSSLLASGSQSDVATEIVRQLPGDIIVTVDAQIKIDGDYRQCNLALNAVERQTGDQLASQSFTSGRYRINDNPRLVAHAVDLMQDDFFSQLDRAFKRRIEEGLSMVVEFQLDQSVSDWNFDSPIPSSGDDFKVWLSDWLRSNSQDGAYSRSASTDKFIRASVKVPLWDKDANRPFGPDEFASKLRLAVSNALDDEYGVKATEMGQRLIISIN